MHEYILLFSSKSKKLSEEVSDYLRAGWSLWGSPFTNDGYFFQAMVK